MQYSTSIHGTATRTEDPAAVERVATFGWGTVVTLRRPTPQVLRDNLTVWASEHPGGWFHVAVPLTLPLGVADRARLDSVTFYGESANCRISRVHVWDGADLIEQFDALRIKDLFRGGSTVTFATPQRIGAAVGVSFYVCAFHADYVRDSGRAWDTDHDGPLPTALMVVAGVSVQVHVPDPPNPFTVASLVSEFFRDLGTGARRAGGG